MNKDNVNYYRDQLEEAALNYARVKTLGYYCEKRRDGFGSDIVRPCRSDVANLMRLYSERMIDSAESLLREMASVELLEREQK